MIITNNGGLVAIRATVNESNLEKSLSAFWQARAVDVAAGLQRGPGEQGADKITLEEINTALAHTNGEEL